MSLYSAIRLVEPSTDPFSRSAPRAAARFGWTGHHPLLALSIGKRLALGFLIPILVILLALGSIGLQSQQLLANVSTYDQHLLHAYSSLTLAVDTLQQTHVDVLGALNDVDNSQTTPETLREDRMTTERLAESFATTLRASLQQDDLDQNPALASLLDQAGHAAQIDALHIRAQKTLSTWQTYQNSLTRVFEAIAAGNRSGAHTLEATQVEQAYAGVMTSLRILIQSTQGLVPAIHDATMVEENQLLLVMILSTLSLLLGIALVAWLVSSTLVRRLQRFRTVIQSVEQGHFAERVAVEGRDEIALVSRAVNTTLDTIVGLLEETRSQHEELAKSEELKHLHEALQCEHEALNEANALLERLSTTDMLTGLPNHRALSILLEQECERARRFDYSLSLLFFDGDRFKQVNDTYGHATGDVVLRELGERASSVLRAGDTVGRFGGEEFLILLPETGAQEAQMVAERLRSTMAALPLAAHEVESGIAMTVSIGVASYPAEGTTASEVLEQADQAMYWAKRLGRNQVCTAAEAARANRDAALKAATAQMLERQELTAADGGDPESRMQAEQLGLIHSLMGALDWREPGMNEHAREVGDLVAGMARALLFDEERTRRAATAAFLHDIGKIALPDRLLQQPRQHFSAQEWQLLHQHAELGAAIVEVSPWLSDLAPAIRYHHARWDGTGTPDGLAGEAIPLEARLIAVAEAYHFMISEHPYQAARSASDALDELEQCAGTQFDPALIPVFRAALESREVGAGSSWEQARPDLLAHV
jgi:diguanylate cyclase (GGDEF)-like protein